MSHIHGVYDSDAHFIIDPVSRTLKNEGSSKATVVQYDHNSERLSFELPKIIEGHDMTTCGRVRVHYINIDTVTKEQRVGLYDVEDLQPSPTDPAKAVFSWLISRNGTQLVGVLAFALRLSCVDDSGEEVYGWSTARYEGFYVSQGIYNNDVIVEEYADILDGWEARIKALEQNDTADKSADWNAADGEPGHVLNRTHYTEEKLNWLAEDTTVKITTTAPVAKSEWIDYATMQGCNMARVIFDGVTYDCPVKWYTDPYMDGDSNCQVGNYLGSNPEIPFGIIAYKGNDGHGSVGFMAAAGTHTVSFAKIEEEVHKLDGKYLPDVVLTSPNGTKYTLTVADDGTLSATPTT